jgi:fluoroacetyl-CoA thioesterase
MKNTLSPGLKHTFTHKVTERHVVPSLLPESDIFSGMPEVLASGYFVGLIEWACMEAMQPHLDAGEGSVGTRFDLSHTSPTPVGHEVVISVECVEVEGRRTVWKFEAHDEKDPIGSGKHERFTVDWEKFRGKLEGKMVISD